jgi:hypothetical protein
MKVNKTWCLPPRSPSLQDSYQEKSLQSIKRLYRSCLGRSVMSGIPEKGNSKNKGTEMRDSGVHIMVLEDHY